MTDDHILNIQLWQMCMPRIGHTYTYREIHIIGRNQACLYWQVTSFYCEKDLIRKVKTKPIKWILCILNGINTKLIAIQIFNWYILWFVNRLLCRIMSICSALVIFCRRGYMYGYIYWYVCWLYFEIAKPHESTSIGRKSVRSIGQFWISGLLCSTFCVTN